MESRPKLRPEIGLSDKIIEGLGYLALITLWILVIFNYAQLPDKIPMHFSASGKIDNYGQRAGILFLPILATVLFAGLSILNRFPWVFNYPRPITVENAPKQYSIATQMLRFMKFILVIVFLLITYETIRASRGNTQTIGVWLLPLVLALVFIPVIYFLVKMMRNK